jgi:REP element-mobilizing transposase RayT
MGLRFPGQAHGHCFFVTTTFADWNPIGDIPGVYDRLADSLCFCSNKYSAHFLGYVFMPSHLHLVLVIDGKSLGPFMRDFKKYLAQKVAADFGIRANRLWMPRYDRVAITSRSILRSKIEYVHNNPVKAGLCTDPAAWPWSSAHFYLNGEPGRLPVHAEWV